MQGEHQIVSVLGGYKFLHHSIKGAMDLDRLIREGFPWRVGMHVKEALRLTDREFATLLGVSERTLVRMRKTGRRMPLEVSDRLYRIAHIFATAKEVLEGEEEAIKWLRSPQVGLGNHIPLDMIQTEAGEREVENLLGRIEHGVLS